MATTEVGNGSAVARMEALASELRLLKSAMADMQGRLDNLLVEIGTELDAPGASESIVEAGPWSTAEFSDTATASHEATAVDAEAQQLAALETVPSAFNADEPAIPALETIVEESAEPQMAFDSALATDAELLEAVDAEPAIAAIETTEAAALEAANADAAETIALEPATPAEPLVMATETTDTAAAPVAAASSANVIDMAERRPTPRKGRPAIARAGRWAAAIALIAVAAALAATGTGFAGYGELIAVEFVCSLAGEPCSLSLVAP